MIEASEARVHCPGSPVIRIFPIAAIVALASAMPPATALARAKAPALVEPTLHIVPGGAAGPRVALTFDACMGKSDMRILDTLIDNRLPATIFVTERWIRTNRGVLETMLKHPDLFEIEDHGAMHVPAVDRPMRIYGIKAAGSAEAVRAEVAGGADAVLEASGRHPQWFRGATAKYTPAAIVEIRGMGLEVAGYSLNGDGGATFSANLAEKRMAAAKDGDVVIAHINQPGRQSGGGVAKGILDLKAKGYRFVKLADGDAVGSDATTGTAK
jgi:peptidoglycan/xylan/chitin deacetylase (PgdA/CDA1 family)